MEPSFKPAEQKLAAFIREHPNELIYLSVNEIASAGGVNEATVIRFARKLGMTGFQELKLHLAREVLTPLHSLHEEVHPEDTTEAILRKVFGSHQEALQDTLQALDPKALEKAAAAIQSARRIFMAAVGPSIPGAIDAFFKFQRLGLDCRYCIDSYNQTITANLVESGDLILVLTQTGQSRDLFAFVEKSRKRGAVIVTITNFSRSPLTRISDILLYAISPKTILKPSGVVSRVAQLAVVDSLWTVIASKSLDRALEIQQNIETDLTEKRL